MQVIREPIWGRKVKLIDTYKMEGVCPIHGGSDLLFPVNNITICGRCMEKFKDNFQMFNKKYQNQQIKYFNGLDISGQKQCMVCKRKTLRYSVILNIWTCTKCCWHILGEQKGRLKI